MIANEPAVFLVVFILGAVGLCAAYAARQLKVQFSLLTVFLAVTCTCVFMALIVSATPLALNFVVWAIAWILPPVHIIVMAALLTICLHTQGERQVIAIGRLLPFGVLGVVEAFRIAAMVTSSSGGLSWIYLPLCIGAYVTSLTSGLVCRETFRAISGDRTLPGDLPSQSSVTV